nr:HrpB1 family type III secretion system apparatus protein [Paraburkholderia sp. UYCP14C]
MSTETPDYLNCSQAIVGGLIDALSCALLNNFPALEADQYDIGLTLGALRLLRPRMAELDTMEAVLAMQRGHWDDAICVRSRVIEGAPQFSYAKALLAFGLSVKGDAGWRQWASAALAQNPDRDTRQLVRALEARDDLREAIGVCSNGGAFEVPPSIAALNDELPAAPSPAGDGAAGKGICASESAGRRGCVVKDHLRQEADHVTFCHEPADRGCAGIARGRRRCVAATGRKPLQDADAESAHVAAPPRQRHDEYQCDREDGRGAGRGDPEVGAGNDRCSDESGARTRQHAARHGAKMSVVNSSKSSVETLMRNQ